MATFDRAMAALISICESGSAEHSISYVAHPNELVGLWDIGRVNVGL